MRKWPTPIGEERQALEPLHLSKGGRKWSRPVERRASSRLIAVKNQAHLELATARGRRKVAARLVNISRGGAPLATGEA